MNWDRIISDISTVVNDMLGSDDALTEGQLDYINKCVQVNAKLRSHIGKSFRQKRTFLNESYTSRDINGYSNEI